MPPKTGKGGFCHSAPANDKLLDRPGRFVILPFEQVRFANAAACVEWGVLSEHHEFSKRTLFKLTKRAARRREGASYPRIAKAAIHFVWFDIRARSASVQSQSVFLSSSDSFACGCIGTYELKGITPSETSSHICRSFRSCRSCARRLHSDKFKFCRPSFT